MAPFQHHFNDVISRTIAIFLSLFERIPSKLSRTNVFCSAAAGSRRSQDIGDHKSKSIHGSFNLIPPPKKMPQFFSIFFFRIWSSTISLHSIIFQKREGDKCTDDQFVVVVIVLVLVIVFFVIIVVTGVGGTLSKIPSSKGHGLRPL